MHKDAKAWAPISSTLATRQTYQQSVADTPARALSSPPGWGQSGYQVSFNLAVINGCTGAA